MSGELTNRQLTALRNKHLKLLSEVSETGQAIFVELEKRYGSAAIVADAYKDLEIGGDSRFFDGEISAAELDAIMKGQYGKDSA
ncbi:hypothetical protein [Motilimonas eburnea]|uniref:hypothetical protein n=1 Tax=Motilimonas eburnea TaxID=1737488 RepID=UPI001E32973D|nr:hypothetical protein [Motilimonas eburnea]MCE2571838.1 hypothetical protein [Motilimonas eburnea]